MLNTFSALSDSVRKLSCSCEYLVIALEEFFATSLPLVRRSRFHLQAFVLWF